MVKNMIVLNLVKKGGGGWSPIFYILFRNKITYNFTQMYKAHLAVSMILLWNFVFTV